ncbi:hypothetical protein BC938DRAFT_475155 [Jimgerdemannia flammicorona]|uniref:Uncharacterized protein n=1 Tax=Jimgerdemannia flammicorona TaxID=994334 RepID=A0A433PZN7_9FUNG|nr:hypothetical protein BC938DRAFT_475155 [Jimgerdemannia flammicorona]
MFPHVLPVDKVILSREAMESFCNDVIPGSFQSVTEVDYTKLCQESLHYIGVYGNPGMIVNLLFRIKAISEDIETLLRSQCETQFDNSKQVSPSLSAGIYLYHDKPSGCGLVIHWPEHGAFMENASSDKKKNMINFQRFVYMSCVLVQTHEPPGLPYDKERRRFLQMER